MDRYIVNPKVPSFPITFADAPTSPRFLSPDVDPQLAFDTQRLIELEPGSIYKWSSIHISRSVTVNGNGAVIYLRGDGPIIYVDIGSNAITHDAFVTFNNCHFKGSDQTPIRDEDMNEGFLPHSAVWVRNSFKTSFIQCSFENFKGAALWLYDTLDYVKEKTWSQQHLISTCRFVGCRIGIATGGACEYSLANNNCFFDCQICFYVIGGNWLRVGNIIANCRSAYFHHGDGMWYQGPAGMQNPAHGAFVGNTMNHCDYAGNVWPNEFVGVDGTTYQLAGMYFNNVRTYPPTWTGNTQYYGDMVIENFKTNNAQKAFSITGCTLMGNPGQDVSAIRAGNTVKDKIWIIGCSGNGIKTNVPTANITPSVVAVPLTLAETQGPDSKKKRRE